MFDIGLSELGVIGIVALVVLGPERLPKVARAAGRWAGKVQRYASDVKAEISREADLAEFKAMQQSVQTVQQEIENTIHQIDSPLPADLDSPPIYRPPRKKFRSRRAALPVWYKRQQGLRPYVQSGAARVKRHRKSYSA